MEAKARRDIVTVSALHVIDGRTIVETLCVDYEHYRQLPDAIEFVNKILCKTGWNSDTGLACYKSGALYARKA